MREDQVGLSERSTRMDVQIGDGQVGHRIGDRGDRIGGGVAGVVLPVRRR
jgi:hypothetical protein